MRHLILASALLGLLMAPVAQGAINQPTELNTRVRFAEAFSDGLFVVSGKMDADLSDASGGSAYKTTVGLTVSNLAQVCWRQQGILAQARCETSSSGGLSLQVSDQGSVGLKLPVKASASVTADHSLAAFTDVGKAFSPAVRSQIDLDHAIVAALVDPLVHVVLDGGVIDGTMIILDAGTAVDVMENGRRIHRAQGEDEVLTFDGIPHMVPFTAETVYMPFRTGAEVDFRPANQEAAALGLSQEAIENHLNQGDESTELDGIHEVFGGSLEHVLNGAVFGFPVFLDATPSDDATLIRFDALTVQPKQGNLLLTGQAPLFVQGTYVQGAPELLGVAWFVLPWWSYALWALAIGAMAARMAKKAPKPVTPGGQRVAGWLVGAVVFVGMLIVWDMEVRSLWGTSVASNSDGSSTSMPLFLAIQLYPMMYGLFAVAAPVRTILLNGFRLLGHGRVMPWVGPAANLVAFVPAALLYRAYLADLLTRVGAALG